MTKHKSYRWLNGLILGLALLCFSHATAAEKALNLTPSATIERLQRDLGFLASDLCEGREPTTKGINLAADYIADQFKTIGLKPLTKNGSYFQYFTIPGATLKEPASLSFKGPKDQTIDLKQGEQFHPLGLSDSGAVKDAGVVFAGYGITGTGDFKYDDYADVNVDGKIVIVLRDTPRATDGKLPVAGSVRRRLGSLTSKMSLAKRNGAMAIIFVNDRDTAKDGDDLMTFSFLATGRTNVTFPAFHLQRSVLDKMLKDAFKKSLTEIEDAIDKDLTPRSTVLTGWQGSAAVSVQRGRISVKNVAGALDGAGPLAGETIVVGAHYDHVGYGGRGSLAPSKKMAIHNGADDNASGTTSVIELARRYAQMPNRQGRRLVFMLFSAEELGLLGSAYYVKNPLVPLSETAAMVNLDMVGRLSPDKATKKGKLQVHGVGTAKTFEKLVDDLNKKYDFTLQKVQSGFGPSDHSSFYGAKIPVLFLFTGTHANYHRPSDTAEKVNYDGMVKIIEMTQEITTHLSGAEKPEYVQIKRVRRPGGGRGPRLGFRPDYGDDKPGVLLGAVTEGGVAAKGGLKEGDRIVAINGKEIKNLEGFVLFMQGQKAGNTIEVSVVRKEEKLKLKLKLE